MVRCKVGATNPKLHYRRLSPSREFANPNKAPEYGAFYVSGINPVPINVQGRGQIIIGKPTSHAVSGIYIASQQDIFDIDWGQPIKATAKGESLHLIPKARETMPSEVKEDLAKLLARVW